MHTTPTGNIPETPQQRTSLYNGQNVGSQWWPLLRGSTVINGKFSKISELQSVVYQMQLSTNTMYFSDNFHHYGLGDHFWQSKLVFWGREAFGMRRQRTILAASEWSGEPLKAKKTFGVTDHSTTSCFHLNTHTLVNSYMPRLTFSSGHGLGLSLAGRA